MKKHMFSKKFDESLDTPESEAFFDEFMKKFDIYDDDDLINSEYIELVNSFNSDIKKDKDCDYSNKDRYIQKFNKNYNYINTFKELKVVA